MKNLNKRILRSIRANLTFYISTGTLTLVTLLIVYLFYIGGTGIKSFGETFFAAQALEDAQFTTYLPISAEDLSALEEEFHVTLEAQKSIDVTENDTTIRIFLANEKIDLYEVTGGSDLAGDYDILISEGYAKNMGVSIGDALVIQGVTYTVSGYFQRPDYLYMLEDTDDSYKNISTFLLAYVSEDAFASLGTPTVTYLVRYEEDNDITFRKAVNARYYLQNYLSADDNMRILMVPQQADMFIMAAYLTLVLMPLIAVMLVCILLSRKIKEEQRLIGTLASFGYTKNQISAHYAVFAALPGLFGGLLSFALGELFAQPYGELTLADYEPLHIAFSLPVPLGLLGALLPTLMYLLAGIFTTRRLLKASVVDLLNKTDGRRDKKARGILRKSNLSFGKKYALRSLFGNPARAFAVTVGVFLGSVIILMGLAILDSVAYISETGLEELGSFEYEYILNTLCTEAPQEGSALLVSSYEATSGKRVTFMGLAADNTYINLSTTDGEAITDLDGWYLSNAAAAALSVEAGDTVTFLSPLTFEEVSITITAIVDYKITTCLFTSMENMAELLGVESGTYNAIMSDVPLSLNEDMVRQVVRKSALLEQCDTILQEMAPFYYVFIFLGIFVCLTSIYAVVHMMVKENATGISMLKILGYEDRQINKIILRANHILLPLGIGISIPAAFAGLKAFWNMFLDYDVMLIETHIYPKTYFLSVALTCACYFGCLAFVGRRTRDVSLEEALKENRA